MTLLRLLRALRPSSPMPRGPRPRRATGAAAFALAAAGVSASAVAFPACMNTAANQELTPVVLGLADTTAPLVQAGETTIYQVQIPVHLPMRKPSDEEAKALGKQDPFPRAPYVLAGDVRIEVHYTLSNLDDAEHSVELLVDPWNEFVRYRPGLVTTAESVTPNFSGFDKFFVLPPKARVEGTLTTDDVRELAVDLATAMSIDKTPPPDTAPEAAGALMNRAMNLQNRSSVFDPLLSAYIPPVTPGLVGFDLGLRSGEKMNVAVELTIDVTDLNGKKVVPSGDTDATIGTPGKVLTPPPPPVMN